MSKVIYYLALFSASALVGVGLGAAAFFVTKEKPALVIEYPDPDDLLLEGLESDFVKQARQQEQSRSRQDAK